MPVNGGPVFPGSFLGHFLVFFVLFCFFVLFLFFILSKFPNSHSLM